MQLTRRRRAAAAAACLVAGLVVVLPQAAQADVPSLDVTVTATGGDLHATLSGSTPDAGYVFAYHQPMSVPCGATAAEEESVGATGFPMVVLTAGAFSEQRPGYSFAPEKRQVCAYLVVPSSEPGAPGPRYTIPVATAVTTVVPYPCSALDTSFAITHFEGQTTWDNHDKATYAFGDLTVALDGPGSLAVTGPDGLDVDEVQVTEVTEAGPQNVSGDVFDRFPGDGRTKDQEYSVVFYPKGFYSSCLMDDGTAVATGLDSGFHAPAQVVDVTWFIAGQGGSATLDGEVLPGSATPYDVPSRVPDITGTSRVGKTVECSVTVPQGAKFGYVWEADGKRWATGRTLEIAPQLLGDELACGVLDNGPHGFPLTMSEPVTVGIGTLRLTKRPKIWGDTSPGGAVAVTYPEYAPEDAILKYRYQWFFGSSPINRATKGNYLIARSAKGKTLSCKVTVTSTGYKKTSATSKAVTVR